MKKIIISLIIGITVSACSDFTDLAPISNRNESAFYTNADDFIFGINASYAMLQQEGVYGRAYWTVFEMRADNTDQGPDATGLSKVYTEINEFQEDALNEQIDAAWTGSYKVIANSNVILDRIGSIEMDATLKSQIIGEALFLRSLMYYHLAVAFGNIPLQLTAFVPGDVLTQTNADAVYTQLVADLTTAETNLSATNAEAGRATKGAAATLLAKVLLTQGNKSGAETVLDRIISTYGYSLMDPYSDLWGAANENNGESIFEVQFISGGIGQGSTFTNDFSPSADLQNGEGFGRNRPTLAMQNSYEVIDLRFASSMGVSYVDNGGNTVIANYVRKFESNPPNPNDADINFVVFRYSDVLLMLAEALGDGPAGYVEINKVRFRAGLPDIDDLTPGTFDEKLLHERQVELAFENHRWADLLRFGVAAQKVNEAEPFIPVSAVRLLFLIPQRELDINSGFTQNTN